MHCMSTNFDVDGSSRFAVRTRTHTDRPTKVAYATDQHTNALATVGLGDNNNINVK